MAPDEGFGLDETPKPKIQKDLPSEMKSYMLSAAVWATAYQTTQCGAAHHVNSSSLSGVSARDTSQTALERAEATEAVQ